MIEPSLDHHSHTIVFSHFARGRKVNGAREFFLAMTISYQDVRNDAVIRGIQGSGIQVLHIDRTADR
jgi:hypothetical protein